MMPHQPIASRRTPSADSHQQQQHHHHHHQQQQQHQFNPSPLLQQYPQLAKLHLNQQESLARPSAQAHQSTDPNIHSDQANNQARLIGTDNSGDEKQRIRASPLMSQLERSRRPEDVDNNDNAQLSNNVMAAPTNSTVIGHYELKKTLGKGNFSTVKLAQHRITNHSVAIKIVKTSVLSEDNLMKINREIDVLKKIRKHRHIVRLYQVIKTKRYFMLVTEYCTNGELYDYLVQNGKLSEAKSCDYFLQILSAVEYLHDNNVVHRDLKAENLLLTDDYKTVKIADFGFANYFKKDKLLSTWCGSPPYAAPELFKGLQYVGPPVDIWSMGVILYVLVCGSLPFDGHNLVYLKTRVLSGKFRIPFYMSTECEGLVRGMLRLDPERRLTTRQIKNHRWIAKHEHPKRETPSEPTNQSLELMDTTVNCIPSNQKPDDLGAAESQIGSVKDLDKSSSGCAVANNRGQSLDLDDDKKKEVSSSTNEDASMLCLTGSTDGHKSASKLSQKDVGIQPSKVRQLVDTEMANAVSNMSLDSNNSSMSMSQSIDATMTFSNHSSGLSAACSSRNSNQRADSRSSVSRNFSKENSIDDQIIEFMVDNLRVAGSQSHIRDSIKHDKYDDLHAIYRLIRDQPKIMFDAQVATKFRMPSLPLLSIHKQIGAKKPSITTGFFNTPAMNRTSDHATVSSFDGQSRVQHLDDVRRDIRTRADTIGSPIGAISLVTHAEHSDPRLQRLVERQRRSEDQTGWTFPPQLFLTPPAEARVAQPVPVETVPSNETKVDSNEDRSHPSERLNRGQEKQVITRHSFDSTMQQLRDSPIMPSQGGNKLTLSNCAKHCLWDSSILDTLGSSTPPLDSSQDAARLSDVASATNQQNQQPYKPSLSSIPTSIHPNLSGISSYLPQIGAHQTTQSTNDHSKLLAQLHPLASSATVTQSSMLGQPNPSEQRYQTTAPNKFMQNNLVNQNLNVMHANQCSAQSPANINALPCLSLLDPNGLSSGLERRASDGQASYSSLTTTATTQVNDTAQTNTLVAANQTNTINLTQPMFMSTSSNQLTSVISTSPTQHMSLDRKPDNNLNAQERIKGNLRLHTAARMSLDGKGRDINQNITQTSPLDLSKAFKEHPLEAKQLADTPLDLTDHQQLAKHISGVSKSGLTTANACHSHISTSASTSPRNSLFMATNHALPRPTWQTSPSTLSLTGGGPGHLLNRRKRHSLETESRHYHHHHHHHHHQPYGNHHHSHLHQTQKQQQHQFSINSPSTINYTSDVDHSHLIQHQPLKSPLSSQFRHLAQTSAFAKVQMSPTGWDEDFVAASPLKADRAPANSSQSNASSSSHGEAPSS